MKAFYSIIALLITIFISGCTKVETISVECGTNSLEPSANAITTDYFTNTSVSFGDYFNTYDTLEILLPNNSKQRIVFPYFTTGYTYKFNTSASVYAGTYVFTHKFSTSKKCNTKTANVQLTLTGSSTSPCQISTPNLLYLIGYSTTYSESYYYNWYNYSFNSRTVYKVQYSGDYTMNFYFYSNTKPKPGDVFTIGLSGSSQTNTEAEISLAGYYANSGTIYCISENNKTYLTFCSMYIGGSNYSTKVELP